tara:strand:- start:449 stop:847 length:399 start_codon:yes stop_codon:yes gene_type:complete
MPRKGKGSKTQSVQTESGQTYGDSGMQEQAQEIAPLPQNVQTELRQPKPRSNAQPGAMGDPFRNTELPDQPLTTGLDYTQSAGPVLAPERAERLPQFLFVMNTLANSPYADESMKEVVRRMEQFVPPNPRAQ